MSACSQDLRVAGLPYPRTCAWCGLGPCRSSAAILQALAYRDAADLAAQIADKVFSHVSDRVRRDDLAALLRAFANEIKRSATEI